MIGWTGKTKQAETGALLAGLGVSVGAMLWGATRRMRASAITLHGQVALVTGASRGLGFLIARELAREGCRLSICARDAEELDRARVALETQGAEVLAVPCDITNQAEVEAWMEQATRHFGQVDILVNNAGVIQVGPVHSRTTEDYETAMAVMFWGVVYPTLAVLPQMRARHAGRIMTITSIGGKIAVPHLLPYSSAKFAAVGFSEGLRAELWQDGISVTTIVPWLMRTGSHLNAWFKGGDWREFALFAPMASLPLISVDAERAAAQMVEALKLGQAERLVGWPAELGTRVQGVAPGLTATLMGIVNRFLPGADAAPTPDQQRGLHVQRRLNSSLLKTLTGWGISAARRFNELPGPRGVSAQQSRRSAAA